MPGLSADPAKRQRQLDALEAGRKAQARRWLGLEGEPAPSSGSSPGVPEHEWPTPPPGGGDGGEPPAAPAAGEPEPAGAGEPADPPEPEPAGEPAPRGAFLEGFLGG